LKCPTCGVRPDANNQPIGPITEDQLHELFRSGGITLDSFIIAEGETEWTAYKSLASPSTPVSSLSSQNRRGHPFVRVVTISAVAILLVASVACGLLYIRDAAANEKQCEQLRMRAKDGDQAALKRIRRAAEMGNKYAQCSFGICYNMGWCVDKNPTEAIKWIRKSAEQGNADAQSDLGAAYASGSGVPKDTAEAIKYWRAAAEQGHATAQTFLGIAYSGINFEGKAVPPNIPEAKKWLRKAADQGNKEAQLLLKQLEKPAATAYDSGAGSREHVDVAIEFLEWKATTVRVKSGGWMFLAIQALAPEVQADVVFRKKSGETQRFHANMARIIYDKKTAEQCVLLYNSAMRDERPNVVIKITNDPDEWKGKGIKYELVSSVMK